MAKVKRGRKEMRREERKKKKKTKERKEDESNKSSRRMEDLGQERRSSKIRSGNKEVGTGEIS